MSAEEFLRDFPICFETPVAWGEMDSFAHVNNVVYFKYFESARIEYFRRIGFPDWMKERGIGPILASTSCRFRKPLTFPDRVTVGARVTGLENDRFTMDYRVVSHALDAVAAEGEGLIVAYDYRGGEKAAVPQEIRARIMKLEGKGLETR